MKRPVTPIFAITTLGMLLGLSQGATLYAQTQVAACPLEGPSIADTLKYINDALAVKFVDPFTETEMDTRLFTENGSLTRAQVGTVRDNTATYTTTAPVYALNCQTDGQSDGGLFYLQMHCRSGNCATLSIYHTAPGPQADDRGSNGLKIVFSRDGEHGQRLVRAFSHLIALLQQQYKQSHSDPNEPFAKSR